MKPRTAFCVACVSVLLSQTPEAYTSSSADTARTSDKQDKKTSTPKKVETEKSTDIKVKVPIDPVVVTGSRTEHKLSETPVATEVIDRKDIEASGAHNAADILHEHAGIDISSSFRGAGIRLQGLESKHVLLLCDGQRMAGRVDGVVDLSRISAEIIERIEVVKGPSSALYGSEAMGGVINVITRRTKDGIEGEILSSYGTLNALDLSGFVGVREDTWDARISGGWHSIDAYDLNPDDPATTGSETAKWNVAGQAEYRFNKNVKLKGRADYLQRDRQGVDSTFVTQSIQRVFDRRNLTEVLSANLGPEIRFDGGGKLSLIANYSLFRDQFIYDQRGSDALDKDQETWEQLGQLTAQYDTLIGDNHLFTVGLEGLFERLESVRLKDGTGDRVRGAVFVQDEWTILEEPNLVLAPGARLDVDSQFGTHATPKITVRVDPTEDITFRSSYGMGFRAPDFKELLLLFENPSAGYVVEGNPDLLPETSHSANLGIEWRPADWIRFTTSFYYNDVENLIFTEPIGSPAPGQPQRYSYTNVASAYTQGMEGQVWIKLVEGLTLDLSYTLTDTRDRLTDRALAGRALHRGNFKLRYRNEDWGFEASTQGTIVGPRPFYPESGTTVFSDPYAALDARVSQKIIDNIQLFAGVENILDEGEIELLPVRPRTIYGGVRGSL